MTRKLSPLAPVWWAHTNKAKGACQSDERSTWARKLIRADWPSSSPPPPPPPLVLARLLLNGRRLLRNLWRPQTRVALISRRSICGLGALKRARRRRTTRTGAAPICWPSGSAKVAARSRLLARSLAGQRQLDKIPLATIVCASTKPPARSSSGRSNLGARSLADPLRASRGPPSPIAWGAHLASRSSWTRGPLAESQGGRAPESRRPRLKQSA